ncbi:MAG: glucosaminidase domain-containing protein [Rikenellaceae bacterium]|nr:glucosaminidase domain-containing protein [Rikenellaceae bacterium]
MNIRTYLCVVALLVVAGHSLCAQDRTTKEQYIEQYKQLAIDDMEKYGIPASIKMAQALLESDAGNSRLARQGNNHFGIKCKKEWTGETIHHDDDAPQECFRKYPSAEASFHDHSEFLDRSPRYQALFELDPLDYKAWAHGLKAAGYATNPKYPELLIKIIEDNKLYLLDKGETTVVAVAEPAPVQPEPTPEPENIVTTPISQVDVDNYVLALHNRGGYDIYLNNGCEFVIAAEGDNINSLEQSLGISAKRLRKMNDLAKDGDFEGGDVVYIKPKAKRSENGHLLHTVREGESLHAISQIYGIRMRNLATLNHLTADGKIFAGQQLKLR